MNLHELPFAKIIILREDIAEVIINEFVEIDESMVKQYHEFLLSHLKSPFSLLVNKINSYTYDFDAQVSIATLKEINVMAVVSYKRSTTISTEMLATAIPRESKWNLQIFSTRNDALKWIEAEQDKVNQ